MTGFRNARALCVAALALCTAFCAQAQPGDPLPVRTNVASILVLSAAEASKGYPAEVRATVTFFDPESGMTFLQDGPEGIFVRNPSPEQKLQRGDEVIVTGMTLGAMHNFITAPRFRIVGANRALPQPLKIEGDLLASAAVDCVWSTVRGHVEQAKFEGGRWTLWLRQNGKSVALALYRTPNDWKPDAWLGRTIVATGVATIRAVNNVPTPPIRLHCASIADLQVEASAPEPELVKVRDLKSIAGSDRYVQLRCRVILDRLGSLLHDETGELAAVIPRVLRDQDEVRVNGFVNSNGGQPALVVTELNLLESATNGEMRVTFTSVPKIRALSRADSEKHSLVRIQGVVTFYDTQYHELFVHDGDSGIYVSLAQYNPALKAGAEVEIAGHTGPGFFAPIIDEATTTILGKRDLPQPRLVSVPELLSGRYDCQPVEIDGVVRRVDNVAGPVELTLMTRSGAISVRAAGSVEPYRPLLNAVVRIRGVGGAQYNENGQVIGPRVFAPGIESFTIEEKAAADPFSAKRLSLEELFRFRDDADATHRAVVSGTVTWQAPEGGLYLENDGASVFVSAAKNDSVHIGSVVEAAGYPEAGRARFAPFLDHAEVRVTGEGKPPQPQILNAGDIWSWWMDASLVTIRARLIQSYSRGNISRSIWKTEGENPFVFEALGTLGSARVAEDSVCHVTGVARVDMNDHREPVGLTLNLRGPNDLAIISAPPWWDGEHGRRITLGLGVLLAASAGWALLLRKQVERQTALVRQQLREQRELKQRYRDLFEQNPHPMWVFDPKTLRYLDVNETAILKYGYSREEFLKMTLLDMRTPEGQKKLIDGVKAGIVLGDQHASIWEHRKKDGALLEVEITSRGITFDGKAARMVLAVDVTERVRAEKALRETEARFRRVIESNLIGIVFFDAKRNVTDANDTFLKMLGLKRERLAERPMPMGQLIAAESLKPTRDAFAALQRGETMTPFEIECVRADQSRLPALVGAVSLGDGGFVGFVVDISRETQLQQQVRLAQKMEAVGLLAGGVAHDFNNLLQVIQGYTLLALERAQENAELADYLQHVKGSAERAAQLTRQLLTFSRQQDLKESDLDLGDTLKEMLKLVRRIIGEHIQVEFSAGDNLAKVRADRGRIEQVIMNLCVNARDAMRNGGTLSIRVENAELSAAELGNNVSAAPGKYVCVRVRDTGCGMDSATMARIFEPFFTTKAKDQGTGLGLSVVYGIVQKHNGVIRVDSEAGKGTVFRIYFPATAGAVDVKIPTTNKAESADKSGVGKILLVEDEPAVRLLASRVLQRAGYEVRTAADGAEACSLFENNGADIDLILMDVIMPKMGGREAYEQIVKKRRDIPVIFCSGYSERELGAEFLESHQLDLLPKPYRPDELLTRVRTRLGAKVS